MTHDELIAKAVASLRKVERLFERHADKLGAEVQRLKVDELPNRTIRAAVVVCFESNDDRGRIEVVMDSQTGEMIDSKFIPPKKSGDDNSANC